jgi:hypothetical protein
MIVRISGDGQYRIQDDLLDRLNAIDDDLETAVQARDEERFRRDLARVLELVRETGEPLGAEHLEPSELILPPDDISLAEIAGELSTDGLIPDRP